MISILFSMQLCLLFLQKLRVCQSFSGHLTQPDIERLQACLNKALRWGFSIQSPLTQLTDYLELYDIKLFKKVNANPEHCLHQLLPLKRDMHGRWEINVMDGHEHQLLLQNMNCIKHHISKNVYLSMLKTLLVFSL